MSLSTHFLRKCHQYSSSQIVKCAVKYSFGLILVLVVCGITAYALSTMFVYIYVKTLEEQEIYRFPSELPIASKCGKKIVGYYAGWEPRVVSEMQISKLTHIIFVAVKMIWNGKVGLHNAEYSQRFENMKEKARFVNSKIKVMVGIGGSSNSQYFSSVIADSVKRKTFAESISSFLATHDVDGVELIWTFPFAKINDRENLVTFFKELREFLSKLEHRKNRTESYLISMMTPQIIWNQEEGYDLAGMVKYVDFFNVVSYEFYGPWAIEEGAFTGPVGPIYGGKRGNIDDTMQYHTCETMKPSHLILGIPLFGRFWRNVHEAVNQTETMCEKEKCRIEGPGDDSEMWRISELRGGKPYGGLITWNDRENNEVGIFFNKSEASWHEISKTSYIWNPEAKVFVTFETKRSIEEKIKYAIEKNLGGINIWSLNMDDDDDTILNLVSSADLCSGGKDDKIKYKCS